MKLTDAKEESVYKFVSSDDNGSFQNRSASMGLVPGTEVQVVRNQKKMPILIFARDTLIAVSRKDAEGIEVNPVE